MNRPSTLITALKTRLAKSARKARNGLAFRNRWAWMAGTLSRWARWTHRLSVPAFGVTQC